MPRAIARAATRHAISRTDSPSQVTAKRCAPMGVREQGALEQEGDDRGERRGMEQRGRLVERALAQQQLVAPVQPRRGVDDDDQRQEGERRDPGARGAEDPVGQPHDEKAREQVGGHQRAAEDALAAAHDRVRAALDQQRRSGRAACRHTPDDEAAAALGTGVLRGH